MRSETHFATVNADTVDVVNFVAVARTLWAGRRIIALCLAILLILTLVFLHFATYKYAATLSVTPAQTDSDGLAGKMGSLGSLASLAGVNLPQGSGGMAYSLYLEGVHSRNLANAVAKHDDLMRAVFPKEWNARRNQWQQPTGPLRSLAHTIRAAIGAPTRSWSEPSGARLQDYLKRELSVAQDPKSPLAVLSFKHPDPLIAAKMLNTVNAEMDTILRAKALERANGNIAYLSQQLHKVTIAEHREAIARSLSEQEKVRMSASSSAPYAAEPFGPAVTSVEPVTPDPVLFLAIAAVVGLFIGAAAVFIRSARSAYTPEVSDSEH